LPLNDHQIKWIHLLPLVLFTLFQAITLAPDIAPGVLDENDSTLHVGTAEAIVDQIKHLDNPIDFWLPTWNCGFPLLHHYQFLSQFCVATIHLLVFQAVSVLDVYHLLVYLLLLAHPWIVIVSLRRMGFSPWVCVFGALFSLSVLDGDGYGHGYASYHRGGHGLFTQLFALTFFPLFLSSIYRQIRQKTGYFQTTLWGFLVGLSHVFVLYIGMLAAGFFWLVSLDKKCGVKTTKRFIVSVLLIVLSLAFFIWPLVLDSDFHANSLYEIPSKLDSYGAGKVLDRLFSGKLFDNDRIPALTAIALLGLLVCLGRRKNRDLAVAGGFALSLLLYFGRPTWGALLKLLPMSADLHFHRFAIGVHVFGTILAGIGAAFLFDHIFKMRHPIKKWAGALALIAVFLIIFMGQFHFLRYNANTSKTMREGYKKEQHFVENLLAKIPRDGSGRGYAGMRAGWGGNYRLGKVPMYNLLSAAKTPSVGHMAFGWSLAGDFSTQVREKNYTHLNLFDIRWIVSRPDDKYWEGTAKRIASTQGHAVYQTPVSGPFELVQSHLIVKADKGSYWNMVTHWLHSDLPRKRQYLRLAFNEVPQLAPKDRLIVMDGTLRMKVYPKGKTTGSHKEVALFDRNDPFRKIPNDYPYFGQVLSFKQEAQGQYQASVQSDSACYLLFKMTYHPGWVATVNGEKTPVCMLSPGFVGIRLDPGTWDVDIWYEAPWYKNWLLLFSITLLAYLAYRERKKKA